MSLWLDFKIFGDGNGLKSPYFDDTFHWMVDTSRGRAGGKGTLYNWIGGHGAQFRSREWRMPRPGTRRRLRGRDYVVFGAERRWLVRVEVWWALARLPSDLEEANILLRQIKRELGETYLGD
jgi:hypothetical protein